MDGIQQAVFWIVVVGATLAGTCCAAWVFLSYVTTDRIPEEKVENLQSVVKLLTVSTVAFIILTLIFAAIVFSGNASLPLSR